MVEPEVFAGTCAACSRPLVQILDECTSETYHPAAEYIEDAEHPQCSALLPIPGTSSFSLKVPAYVFVLDIPQPNV